MNLSGLSRITERGKDSLVDKVNLAEEGKALFRRSRLFSDQMVMKAGKESRRFPYEGNPTAMIMERFLEAVDGFLNHNSMYLTDANCTTDILTTSLIGFHCYTITGQLYREIKPIS